MLRVKHTIIVFFLSVLVAGCGGAGGDKDIYVKNVVDGDTVELSDGRQVRYIGVDTPETMKHEMKEQRERLEALRSEKGDYVSPV